MLKPPTRVYLNDRGIYFTLLCWFTGMMEKSKMEALVNHTVPCPKCQVNFGLHTSDLLAQLGWLVDVWGQMDFWKSHLSAVKFSKLLQLWLNKYPFDAAILSSQIHRFVLTCFDGYAVLLNLVMLLGLPKLICSVWIRVDDVRMGVATSKPFAMCGIL